MKRPPIFPFFTNMAESNQTHSASPPGQHPPCPAWHPDGFPASEHRHNRKKLVNDYSGGFVFTPRLFSPTTGVEDSPRSQDMESGNVRHEVCHTHPNSPHLVLAQSPTLPLHVTLIYKITFAIVPPFMYPKRPWPTRHFRGEAATNLAKRPGLSIVQ